MNETILKISFESDLRPCEIRSHQYRKEGVFHRWTERDGKLVAVIELPDGNVAQIDMTCHSVKFNDRKTEEPVAEGRGGNSCSRCGGELAFSSRQIGDGLCHCCGHMKAAELADALKPFAAFYELNIYTTEGLPLRESGDNAQAFIGDHAYVRAGDVKKAAALVSGKEPFKEAIQQIIREYHDNPEDAGESAADMIRSLRNLVGIKD